MSTVISEFLEAYAREFDFYDNLASLCARQIESELRRSGLRALVTSRAKRADSLREKLIHRNRSRPYNSVQDIRDDISDFAGVRIAIYFTTDRDIVDEILRRTFDVRHYRVFPQDHPQLPALRWKKRFSGYGAAHYRLTMRPDDAATERFSGTLVEVQVASVLMHAWAEVEHDLLYKPNSGQPSVMEQAILDELNGLVIAGDIALERLQSVMQERLGRQSTQFTNHYDLAAYIYALATARAGEARVPSMGRADVLWDMLQRIEHHRPQKLEKIFKDWVPDIDQSHSTLVEQIVDHITRINPTYLDAYQAARAAAGERNPYADSNAHSRDLIARFMGRYAEAETALVSMIKVKGVGGVDHASLLYSIIDAVSYSSEPDLLELKNAARLRHQIVHEGKRPADSLLQASIVSLEQALARFQDPASSLFPLVKKAFEERLNQLASVQKQLDEHLGRPRRHRSPT